MKRQYFGESIAAPLVKWLNNRKAASEHRAVLKLMSIEGELRTSRDLSKRTRLTAKANDVVSGVRFYPLIADVKGTWKTLWQTEEYGSTGDYVHRWLELLEKGLLPQLKRCGYKKCRRFFFAKFPHTKFHSIKCRDAEKASDPVWREKRRGWERKHYRDYYAKKPMKGVRA